MNNKAIIEALAVLGLKPGATHEECQIEWRALSKKHHPDLHAVGSPEHAAAADRQRQVNAAYDLLKTADLDSLPCANVEMPKTVASADNWDTQLEKARAVENAGDILHAVEVYKALAGQGFAKAQFRLGYVYFDSVLKDMHLAVYWWKRAAEQGHAAAQYNLGLMCERGLGMPVDMREAMQWFEKAANAGDEKARAKLLAAMRNSPVAVPVTGAKPKEVPEEPTAFIGKPRSASETEQAGKAFFTRKK